jgi:hypothetical protein
VSTVPVRTWECCVLRFEVAASRRTSYDPSRSDSAADAYEYLEWADRERASAYSPHGRHTQRHTDEDEVPRQTQFGLISVSTFFVCVLSYTRDRTHLPPGMQLDLGAPSAGDDEFHTQGGVQL